MHAATVGASLLSSTSDSGNVCCIVHDISFCTGTNADICTTSATVHGGMEVVAEVGNIAGQDVMRRMPTGLLLLPRIVAQLDEVCMVVQLLFDRSNDYKVVEVIENIYCVWSVFFETETPKPSL